MSRLRFPLVFLGTVLALGALAWHSFTPRPAATTSPHPFPSTGSARHEPVRTSFRPAPALRETPGVPLERRCLALAERDPREAVNFAIDHQLCDTNVGLLEDLAAQWAAQNFRAAHAWVLQQEPGEWRDGLLARVAFAGSQSEPATAARIVVEEMTPGPIQTEAAISVLHQWALRDLDAAAAWATAFPATFRARALAEIEGIRRSRQAAALGTP